jgi:hypothetical protein
LNVRTFCFKLWFFSGMKTWGQGSGANMIEM